MVDVLQFNALPIPRIPFPKLVFEKKKLNTETHLRVFFHVQVEHTDLPNLLYFPVYLPDPVKSQALCKKIAKSFRPNWG